MSAPQQPPGSTAGEPVRGRRLAVLSLTALDVVFGDIGTSPLYAVRECFHGEYGWPAAPRLSDAGKAVFMAATAGFAPPALVHNLEHNRVLHESVACLTVVVTEGPRVPRDDKVAVRAIGSGFYEVLARFGYMEQPIVPYVLALACEQGLDFELDQVSFYLGRERVIPDRRRSWRPGANASSPSCRATP